MPTSAKPINSHIGMAKAFPAACDVTVSVQKQLLDAQLRLDGDHRRQKNDLSEFVEASVSFMHMMKRGKGKEDDKIKK